MTSYVRDFVGRGESLIALRTADVSTSKGSSSADALAAGADFCGRLTLGVFALPCGAVAVFVG